MLTSIYLPAAAPFIVAGVRLGFGMAIKGMVIAELWVLAGPARLLETFSRSPMRLDLYYALVLLIIGFAVSVNECLKWAERKLRPAAQHGRVGQVGSRRSRRRPRAPEGDAAAGSGRVDVGTTRPVGAVHRDLLRRVGGDRTKRRLRRDRPAVEVLPDLFDEIAPRRPLKATLGTLVHRRESAS